eukprot:7546770-Alexandrium_andersonii.AAC.1
MCIRDRRTHCARIGFNETLQRDSWELLQFDVADTLVLCLAPLPCRALAGRWRACAISKRVL